MAMRRTRIKGIAHIPQRRKPTEPLSTSILETTEELKNEISGVTEVLDCTPSNNVIVETESEVKTVVLQPKVLEPEPALLVPEADLKVPEPEPALLVPEADLKVPEPELKVPEPELKVPEPELKVPEPELKVPEPEQKIPKPDLKVSESELKVPETELKAPETELKPVPPGRRRFIKPAISVNLLNQKSRAKVVPETPIVSESIGNNEIIATLNETVIHSDNGNIVVDVPPFLPTPPPLISIRYESDSESTAPPSPTKIISRSRIKPIPRLGQRRTSFSIHGSASESEDDVRRNYKRIRNDSVCSTISACQETPQSIDMSIAQKNKEFSSVIQRKCRRTEQSRKMAEARREFILKFGDKTPDRQKLTMIDLIFYNPTTNPMSQKIRKPTNPESEVIKIPTEIEEKPDDPEPPSDDDNAIPAPQIKIGPNGEIVIDEQSLVIENAKTKKDREQLQKSEIVDGDFDTRYGVYKRVKRSKDWSKSETLRFYKALNTIGTDFTLMCELFPRRSRRELKMKFKKEERVNYMLIDRAITQPIQFDITELKQEVELEERELIEYEKRKQEQLASKKKPLVKNCKRSFLERELEDKTQNSSKKRYRKFTSEPDAYSHVEQGINSVLNDPLDALDSEISNVSETANLSDNSNSSEQISTPKPTRSGRIPKSRGKEISEKPVKEEEQLEPGSIMIISRESETGKPVYSVYMVTPGQNKETLNVPADVLNSLTQSALAADVGFNAENILTISAQETIEEHNITIPAVENEVVIEQENEDILGEKNEESES